MLDIITLKLGPLQNNVYIVYDKKTLDAAIIDPAWSKDTMMQTLKKHQLKLKMILVTHTHFDHINALKDIVSDHKVHIYMSNQYQGVFNQHLDLVQFTKHKQHIWLGESLIHVIHTPGHSIGCQSFYHHPFIFTGDCLFLDRVGRCDLEESDPKKMFESITHLVSLPKNTIVCPGHYYSQTDNKTLEEVIQTNSFLRIKQKQRFITKLKLLS